MSVRGDGRERSQEISKRILRERERVNGYHTESEVDCRIRASERKRERRQRLRAGGPSTEREDERGERRE